MLEQTPWNSTLSTAPAEGSLVGLSRLKIQAWLPILALFVFALLTSANQGFAASGGNEVYHESITSNPVRQASFLGLAGMAMFLWFIAKPATDPPTIHWSIFLPIVLLTGFLFLSILWSDEPGTTLKRAITASIVAVTGVAIGRVWDTRALAWGVLAFSLLFLAASVLAEVRYRSFLMDEYRFSGLIHPIRQSFNCLCLLLASVVLYSIERRRLFLIIIAIAILFLLMTKARTGVIAAVLSLGWILWHVASIRVWLLGGAVSLGLMATGLLFYEAIAVREADVSSLAAMGRDEEQADPTKLTGRWDIWGHVLPDVLERPLLGYGFGAYWHETRWTEFERATGWPLYHSHSTYFETALGIGVIGLLLGALVLGTTFYRTITLVRSGDDGALLTAGLIIMAVIGGVSDVAFLQMEYESVLMMSAIGVMVFAQPASGGAER
ncbi:MAG: O-antigen ligase family protein [Planctomycetaceae bacterium]|nr:O-antigen ligase family protein [Planctomycetaceae bacterium]